MNDIKYFLALIVFLNSTVLCVEQQVAELKDPKIIKERRHAKHPELKTIREGALTKYKTNRTPDGRKMLRETAKYITGIKHSFMKECRMALEKADYEKIAQTVTILKFKSFEDLMQNGTPERLKAIQDLFTQYSLSLDRPLNINSEDLHEESLTPKLLWKEYKKHITCALETQDSLMKQILEYFAPEFTYDLGKQIALFKSMKTTEEYVIIPNNEASSAPKLKGTIEEPTTRQQIPCTIF